MSNILAARKGPHGAIDFNAFNTDDFLPDLEQAIRSAHVEIQKIKSEPASFDRTIVGLEDACENVDFIYNLFNNLMLAESSDKIRSLAQTIGPKVSDFYNDVLLDEELFSKIRTVYQQRDSLRLNTEETRFLERMHSDFERHGATLNIEAKTRLRAIDQELARLHPRFGENVLKSTNEFELWISDPKDLAGLPDTFREAALEEAKAHGRENEWLITLHEPCFIPIMKFAENRSLRERVWRAYNQRATQGTYENQPIIKQIVSLMNEKARLLGFSTYAEFALKRRMAETPTTVMQFLDRMFEKAKPVAEREVHEVQKLASSLGGPNPIQQWDFRFYSEKLRELKYAYDEEALRSYFPLTKVVEGVMVHAQKLFGLSFEKSDQYSVYHKDVEVFEVFNESTKAFLGVLYLDFFPRSGKSQGAWMTNFLEQGRFHAEVVRPHVSIVCNFTKPTSSKPSLLSFDEVNTLFHEFGHALHSLLSQCTHRTLSGTNVFLDFVELPSQIMENWLLEPEALALFAHHYFTNDVLPATIVEKLKESDRFLVGYQTIRQLAFAYLDMAWFTSANELSENVPAFESKAIGKTRLLPHVDGTNISCQFTHIFSGSYAAGYYSYKWAEALDADAFELFKEKGIYNKEVAQSFAQNILARGGSEHPMRLFERFRGRRPDPDALLKRDGML